MSDIIPLGNITLLDLIPDSILEQTKGSLKGVVIMGFDNDDEPYFASSYADGGTILWLMEKCKARLLVDQNEE